MEFTGTITGIGINYQTKKFQLTLEAEEPIGPECERLKDCKKLRVTVRRHHSRRSLDANAYAWALMQKMAEALRTDKDSVYLQMLSRYGKFTHVIVKPEAAERMKQEWRIARELGEITVGGQTGVQLQCFFGSSAYDSKEMSEFIDGIISECRELGIETAAPEEMERMKREWGV